VPTDTYRAALKDKTGELFLGIDAKVWKDRYVPVPQAKQSPVKSGKL
jgi:hypothetical protein